MPTVKKHDDRHHRDVPPGFVDPGVPGFTGNNGTIWRRTDEDGDVVSGFFVEERHCNSRGLCHGGWLATFADVAMVREAARCGAAPVTVSLAIDYIRPIPLGAWVQSRTEALPGAGKTVHVQGIATAGDEVVMRMNAAFRVQARPDSQ